MIAINVPTARIVECANIDMGQATVNAPTVDGCACIDVGEVVADLAVGDVVEGFGGEEGICRRRGFCPTERPHEECQQHQPQEQEPGKWGYRPHRVIVIIRGLTPAVPPGFGDVVWHIPASGFQIRSNNPSAGYREQRPCRIGALAKHLVPQSAFAGASCLA